MCCETHAKLGRTYCANLSNSRSLNLNAMVNRRCPTVSFVVTWQPVKEPVAEPVAV